MSLRQSSSAVGRGKKTVPSAMFFEEWLPKDDGSEENHETAQDRDNRMQNETKAEYRLHQRLLLMYQVLKGLPGSNLLLTQRQDVKSREDLVKRAEKVYQTACKSNERLCGDKYSCPCIMQLGGEVACAELSRLHTRFDEWLRDRDLADPDSTLCLVAHKLTSISGRRVHCIWDSMDSVFVLFSECSTQDKDSGD